MNEPVLHLHSDGLLSKWGFSDGDCPPEWLDYCDATGMDYPENWRAVLVELVKQRLLPALDQDVETEIFSTIHNPIRARAVDGADVTHFHSTISADPPGYPLLTPRSVSVPYSVVQRVIREVGGTP